MNRRSFFSIVAAVAAAVTPKWLWGRDGDRETSPVVSQHDARPFVPHRYRHVPRNEVRDFAPKDAANWPEWFSFLYHDRESPGYYFVRRPGREDNFIMRMHLVRDPHFWSQHMTFDSLLEEVQRRAKLLGF